MAGVPLLEADVRKLIVPRWGYRLYYVVDADTVTIISIRHPAEDRDAVE